MRALVLLSFLLPAVLMADPICFNADTATKVEAPMELAALPAVPADIRDLVSKGPASGKILLIAQGKGTEGGVASYTFMVAEAGEYYLWCRTWWLDECGNSFFISLDDAKPFVFGEDSTLKSWHWVRAPLRLKQLTLEKGSHTLTFKNREDGPCLDQILLTSDKNYVPVDVENVTAPVAP